MVTDDYAYCFSFADWTRIHSVGQIISSMSAHRITTNGRILVHGIVQLLLMLPRCVFAMLNAAVTLLMLYLIRRLISLPGKPEGWIIPAFGLFFLCCFTPALGKNTLWLTGAINYSWSATFSLLFLFPFLYEYLNTDWKVSTISTVLYVFLAFFVGTCSESCSLVVLVLAVCFCLLTPKKSRSVFLCQILWIVSALCGYAFLMTAPATSGRAGVKDLSYLGFNFRMVFQAAETYLLVPFLIFAILLSLSISLHGEKKRTISACLLFLGGLAALAAYIFAAYLNIRHLFFTVFFTMLACCLLLSALCYSERPIFSRVALGGILVLFLLQFPVGLLDIAISFHKQQLRERQIYEALASGETTITVENYYPYTSYGVAFFADPYEPPYGPNANISDYYGLDVYGIDPQEESTFS